jgi:hypothetical protein
MTFCPMLLGGPSFCLYGSVKVHILRPCPLSSAAYPLTAPFPSLGRPRLAVHGLHHLRHGARGGLAGTIEIRYSGRRNVYKTESFRCQDSGTRLYLSLCGEPAT